MKKLLLIVFVGCLLAACGKENVTGPQVVAHRGYWKTEGSAQNSISSLMNAGRIGAYGSEFDVNLTADDQLVINHDFTYKGFTIRETTLAELRNDTLLLANGEIIPTLDEYLEASLQYPELKLIFELKSKGDPEYEATAIRKSIEAFKRYGVKKRIIFISFSLSACKEFARLMPKNRVEYLGGEIAPAELKKMGINGIDYHHSVFLSRPEWVVEAHNLGMKVNVWTVDEDDDIKRMLLLGVDEVTTNMPEQAMRIIESGDFGKINPY
jgi:glycerophosphoryl diester phosphodiesterase